MSHPKTPPSLPTIVDEAGDTPNWVPALGFLLFVLFALVTAARIAMHDKDETTTPPAAAAAAPEAVPSANP
jgi:hypothetical protein